MMGAFVVVAKLLFAALLLVHLSQTLAVEPENSKIATEVGQKGPEKLSILLVMASLGACQSHVQFAKMLANVLKKRHSVYLLLIRLTDQEVNFETEDGGDGDLTIEHYVPKDERLMEFLVQRHVPDYHANFARMYNLMANDGDLVDRLTGRHFHVGITEFVFFTRTAPFLFHKLKIPHTMYYNHAANPQQLHDLGAGTWDRVLKFPMPVSGKAVLPEFSAIYREGHRKAMVEKNESFANGAHESLQKIDVWLKEQMPTYPGTIRLFEEAPFYLMNTIPEIEMDGGEALGTALNGQGRRKVVMIGGVHIKGKFRAKAGEEAEMGEEGDCTREELEACVKLHKYMRTRIGEICRRVCGRELDKMLDLAIEAKALKLSKKGPIAGIVLMTMGTVIKTWEKIRDIEFSEFLAALDAFPRHLFIVQLNARDADRIKVLNGKRNVFASHWVQQQQILADPRTRVFISHCGRHGQLEGVYFGKPMICLPFQMDQPYNAVLNLQNELGTALDIKFEEEKQKFSSSDPEDVEGLVPSDQKDGRRDFRFTAENVVLAIRDALGENTRHIDMAKVKSASEKMRQRNAEELLFGALETILEEEQKKASDGMEVDQI